MRIWIVLLIALAATVSGYSQKVKRTPNVIVILSDDQGYGDFSSNGNPVLQTPALDKLANEGVRFTDFHVSPYCTPTRGQLLSGLDALHNKAATVGTGRNTMKRDIVTMPEVFKRNGYHTGIFGKWHLGDNYPDRPMDRGFDKCVWFKGWGLLSESEYDNDYYNTRYMDGLTPVVSGKYCTDLWFDEAMKWMDQQAAGDQPFFTYIATNAPHGPFYALPADVAPYKDKVDSSAAAFFGMLKNIDRNVGRLDEWLEKKHLKNNTIVIYMNDNGGTGGVDVYNAGLRGKKGENYDGGHRAVCFFRWPDGGLTGPRAISAATQVQDLLPTFIDLLGFSRQQLNAFDGTSLASLLTASKPLNDRMFVVQYGGGVRPEKYFNCVVWNSWRLVGKDELYDVAADPGQQHDISKAHPDVLKKMQAHYEHWWAGVAPGIDEFVPVEVGTSRQEAVVMTSDFWANGDYVNTQWKVAQAAGEKKGGTWHIDVKEDGRYIVELSRWPFHLNRALNEAGIGKAIGGTPIRKGKALPIQSGALSVNGRAPLTADKASPNATEIRFDVKLTGKDRQLQAWFRDKQENDVCGAYYVRLTKVD